MTEAEWVACEIPLKMLEFLCDRVSDRKLRLFACACCNRVLHFMVDERSRLMVAVTERYADVELSINAWQSAVEGARAALFGARDRPSKLAAGVALNLAWTDANRRHSVVGIQQDAMRLCWEPAVQASFLHCIIGSPFQAFALDPAILAWSDGTVRRITQAIYGERAFDRLPVLHDALLDAGCDNEDILAHCRSGGPHVRGCWVIDLILGKE